MDATRGGEAFNSTSKGASRLYYDAECKDSHYYYERVHPGTEVNGPILRSSLSERLASTVGKWAPGTPAKRARARVPACRSDNQQWRVVVLTRAIMKAYRASGKEGSGDPFSVPPPVAEEAGGMNRYLEGLATSGHSTVVGDDRFEVGTELQRGRKVKGIQGP